MISHPKCILSKEITVIPDCIQAITKLVDKTEVSLTLKKYRSVNSFRHLKRVRPEKNSGKLEILVGKNSDEFVNFEDFREIKVPARAPLSRWEWKISNSIIAISSSTKPRACCRARTAQCLSCVTGLSIFQYCHQNPDTVGC